MAYASTRGGLRGGGRGLARIGVGAEIDLDHARIAGDLRRQPFGNLLAVIEHHHAIDHAHQHAHDVLDPDDGDAELVADVAQHVGGLVHLGLVETAEAFIGKQQLWPGRQRLCQFELLQAGRAEAIDACMAVGRQTDHGERALGGLSALARL